MAARRSWMSCRFEALIFVFSLLCFGFGSQVRLLTTEDLKNIGESTTKDFIAVFFDKPGENHRLYFIRVYYVTDLLS